MARQGKRAKPSRSLIELYDPKIDSFRPITLGDVNAMKSFVKLVGPKLKALDPVLFQQSVTLYNKELLDASD